VWRAECVQDVLRGGIFEKPRKARNGEDRIEGAREKVEREKKNLPLISFEEELATVTRRKLKRLNHTSC